MTPTIRSVRRAELPQVYDLLEAAFPEARRATFVAQTEADSTFRLRHGRLAVADGRIVGYVRIFARTMMVRGQPVPVGGIGSVATHPDARGSGIATALLHDAIARMRRGGMQASFLYTGIPGFYERLGFHIVREPQFEAGASEVAALPDAGLWDLRPLRDADVPRMLAIYRRASAGSTGAVVRTARTWRDAGSWLDEDPGGCFVAERNGVVVAYLRSRCRTRVRHEVLESECLPGHEGAIATLLSAVGRRAVEHGERIVALVPDGHPLATALRSLASTTATTDVRFPMMMLGLGDPAVEEALRSEPIRFWNTDRI